ncbi:divalent-cation tolerance protein CutA [Saccharomonospora piscinae]|uniref:divalent-cation tolerance protein CutA n=1 Tax=Saccharomonospora piscinae TaxID=687388 RepID=UPI000465FCFE|nr:divalent-cation tolerance protein CutA [Saccharomonospora piscinae]
MIPEQVLVSTTTDSDAAARQLAADAVEARLGACAQVVGPITSVYRWEGRVHTDPEWRVEVKTAADRADALVAQLRQRHTYDVPEVITTPIVGGSADYLAWVVEQTRPE